MIFKKSSLKPFKEMLDRNGISSTHDFSKIKEWDRGHTCGTLRFSKEQFKEKGNIEELLDLLEENLLMSVYQDGKDLCITTYNGGESYEEVIPPLLVTNHYNFDFIYDCSKNEYVVNLLDYRTFETVAEELSNIINNSSKQVEVHGWEHGYWTVGEEATWFFVDLAYTDEEDLGWAIDKICDKMGCDASYYEYDSYADRYYLKDM